MTYIFYKDIIAEIAINLQYQSVVHLLARDYSDESVATYVEDHNPFLVNFDKKKKSKKGKKAATPDMKVATLGNLRQLGVLT